MALCHFSSAACTVHKLAPSSPASSFPGADDLLPRWATFLVRPPRRDLAVACFAKKPRASRKPRPPKLNLSDDELCNELRKFVSEQGLVVNRLPSMAELSRRGRKDLANLVRRRGYKVISKMFENQINVCVNVERSLSESTDPVTDIKYSASEPLGESLDKLDDSFSSDLLYMKKYILNGNGACTTVAEPSESFERNLQAALSFRHSGETYPAPDVSIVNNIYDSQKNHETSNFSYAESGLFDTQESTESKSKQPYSENSHGEDISSGEEDSMADIDAGFISEAAEIDKQREINRLRTMLHEKEAELQQLKQEIEKEKIALTNLQRKARAEIDNIQSLISAKEEELRAAEEGLFGLKEVQIEFRVHGESVELMGSFNGWQHRIKMDRLSFSNGQITMDSRNSALWSITLWLYPGVYEIKFVVDGHWMTDPQRESVTKGHITNNILRVE